MQLFEHPLICYNQLNNTTNGLIINKVSHEPGTKDRLWSGWMLDS